MRRVFRPTVLALALLAVAAAPLAGCGGGDDHEGHEHGPGESHDDPPAEKAK